MVITLGDYLHNYLIYNIFLLTSIDDYDLLPHIPKNSHHLNLSVLGGKMPVFIFKIPFCWSRRESLPSGPLQFGSILTF
jgi:hypothetical protein